MGDTGGQDTSAEVQAALAEVRALAAEVASWLREAKSLPSVQSPPPVQWYTRADVARICQVHPDTVKKWIRDGLLDTVKIGRSVRITQAAIDDLVYRRRVRALGNRPRRGPKRRGDRT